MNNIKFFIKYGGIFINVKLCDCTPHEYDKCSNIAEISENGKFIVRSYTIASTGLFVKILLRIKAPVRTHRGSDSYIRIYFYRKDAQGNIIALLDEAGNVRINKIDKMNSK